MQPLTLSGAAFASLVGHGDLYERTVDAGTPLLLVEGGALADGPSAGERHPDGPADGGGAPGVVPPDVLDRLATLPVVVVAVVEDPGSVRPAWADLAVAPDSPELESVVATVSAHPLASTALALLLRTGEGRTIPEGLVAESTAYGLLQGGAEFADWRQTRPRRQRPSGGESPVLVSRSGSELSIRLNRPHVLNAFDAGMRNGLLAALDIARFDPSVTSVAVRGNGEAFCSGGDLDEFGTRPDPVVAHVVRLQRNAGRAMADISERTTVHIHGPTMGSGIELAAFAGRVVAAPSTRISLPEVRLGLIPGAGGTVSVPRRIGRHRTMLLALGPGAIDAPTALDWGLVDALGE